MTVSRVTTAMYLAPPQLSRLLSLVKARPDAATRRATMPYQLFPNCPIAESSRDAHQLPSSPLLVIHGTKGWIVQPPTNGILQVVEDDGADHLLDANLPDLDSVVGRRESGGQGGGVRT